jgi:hypothetical protein
MGGKAASKSKTQLAPVTALPEPTGDVLVSDPADEDVLAVPPSPEVHAQPDTAPAPLPPPKPEPAPAKATPRQPIAEKGAPTKAAAPGRSPPRPAPTKARVDPEPKLSPPPKPSPQPKPVAQPLIEPASIPPAQHADAAPTTPPPTKPERPPANFAPVSSSARAAATTPGTDARGRWVKAVLIVLVVGALAWAGYYLMTSDLWGIRRRTVYPTEGSVYFQGKPAAGARVTLIPVDKGRDRYFPTGKVGPDGSFKLTTYETDDGAPAGRYHVTIVRGQMEADEYAELSKKMSPQDIAQLAKKMARDPLFDKYANPRDSGLTTEITSQSLNKLDRFDLR